MVIVRLGLVTVRSHDRATIALAGVEGVYSARAKGAEHFRHDVAGEDGGKDANNHDAQAILAVVQKRITVVPFLGRLSRDGSPPCHWIEQHTMGVLTFQLVCCTRQCGQLRLQAAHRIFVSRADKLMIQTNSKERGRPLADKVGPILLAHHLQYQRRYDRSNAEDVPKLPWYSVERLEDDVLWVVLVFHLSHVLFPVSRMKRQQHAATCRTVSKHVLSHYKKHRH